MNQINIILPPAAYKAVGRQGICGQGLNQICVPTIKV